MAPGLDAWFDRQGIIRNGAKTAAVARITGQEGRRRRRGKGQVAPNVRRKEGRRLRFDLRMGEFAGVKNDRKMTTFAAAAMPTDSRRARR